MEIQLLKMRTIRNSILFCFIFLFFHSANANSQIVKVNVNLKNATIDEIIHHVSQKINYRFLYQMEEVQQYGKRSINLENAGLSELMKELLKGTHLSYTIQNDVVIITPQKEQYNVERVELKGKIVDENQDPLPGVTVRIKNTNWGVSSDIHGNFRLDAPMADSVYLVFSFVGKKQKSMLIRKQNFKKEIMVMLMDDVKQIEEVVVTGIMSNMNKNSFTGASVTVTQEQLLKVSKTNILTALQSFDPSFRIQKNNTWGSDPNSVPEVYIRGRSGIGVRELDKEALAAETLDKKDLTKSSLENNPNLPTFIMDGFEVSVEKVYDTDPNRIANITILKDAAATAMYGSRAANGVVVITTVAPKPGRLMVSYSFTGSLTLPDLSDFNLADAEEKLEIERLSGLYEPEKYAGSLYSAMRAYNERLQLIREGVNTDWLSIPLQNSFEQQHSLFIEGGNKDLRYGLSGTFHKQPGVMKGSSRDRTAAGFYIDYRLKSLQITNNVTYTFIKGKESPYGEFSDYSKLMPYDRPYDMDGNLEKRLKYSNIYNGADQNNPLYEALLDNFNINSTDEFINNFKLIWNVTSSLSIRGQFSVTKNISKQERFIDPLSAQVSVKGGNKEDGHLLGDLFLTKGDRTKWDGSVYVNFQRTMGKHNLNFASGINALSSKIENYIT
ncbi:MAG: carboxypeptidase-like regulatory domain-containing protein, partial [Odoribacter sp.]